MHQEGVAPEEHHNQQQHSSSSAKMEVDLWDAVRRDHDDDDFEPTDFLELMFGSDTEAADTMKHEDNSLQPTTTPTSPKPSTTEKCNNKRQPCPFCQKSVTALSRHILVHTGERPYACHLCKGKTFKRSDHLAKHMKQHNSPKIYRCKKCPGMIFYTQSEQLSHRLGHAPTPTPIIRPHRCDYPNCSYAFRYRSQLNTHLKRHIGEKIHHCDQCSLAFVTRGELTVHVRRHIYAAEDGQVMGIK